MIQNSLSTKELRELSLFLYQQNYWNRGSRKGLFSWEKTWAEGLKSKSQVLVTAAGDGREAEALEALGHDVWALEPAEQGFKNCRKRMDRPHQAFSLSHEGLVDILKTSKNHPLCKTEFDAVMIGWGSLTHCYGEETRNQLFSTLAKLCPRGTILGSFWSHGDLSQLNLSSQLQRKFGEIFGSLLWQIRSSGDLESLPIMLAPKIGPGVCFHEEEVKRLADHIQASVSIFLDSPQPYAIFTR